MSEEILNISDDFWNIRGDFRIAGLLNIGTHASLIRRASGKFLMLDAYTLSDSLKSQVDSIMGDGENLEAIINLHPFHTVHVEGMHKQYPQAKLYGTQRHHEKFPHLEWEPELTESEACAALFADDLDFSIPAGVDFISKNENLHFSSVLAYHAASRTIHSDDTLMYTALPGPVGKFVRPGVSFHITLSRTLERRAGAARDFRDWARGLADDWAEAENLCAAHTASLPASEMGARTIAERILSALRKVERTLRAHEKKYG